MSIAGEYWNVTNPQFCVVGNTLCIAVAISFIVYPLQQISANNELHKNTTDVTLNEIYECILIAILVQSADKMRMFAWCERLLSFSAKKRNLKKNRWSFAKHFPAVWEMKVTQMVRFIQTVISCKQISNSRFPFGPLWWGFSIAISIICPDMTHRIEPRISGNIWPCYTGPKGAVSFHWAMAFLRVLRDTVRNWTLTLGGGEGRR